MFNVDSVLAILAGLGGLGTLVSMLVNILKSFGVVHDGSSDKWIQGINLGAFVAVSLVLFFNVPVDWGTVDAVIMFLVTLLGFVVQLFGSKFSYQVTRGIPLIGFSYNTD